MPPPNVLLITADQLRQDALGCYDNPVISTPHIDALAARGVRFDRVYAAYPVCAPNRVSLATGRYPSIHGVRNNGIFMPRTELTFMEVLRQRGYATYAAGKTHFGPQWRFPPDGRPLSDPQPDWAINPQPEPWEMPWYGLERVCLTEDHRAGPYANYLRAHGLDPWADPHSFSYPQHVSVRSAYPEEHHQTTWVADRAIEFLQEHPAERPFFLWTSFVHPHHPFTPPAPYDTLYDPARMPLPVWDETEVALWPERYRHTFFRDGDGYDAAGMYRITDAEWQRIKAFYYGMISLIDKQVGRLVEVLRARGLLDNTLILFTADHGEMLGDHHMVFKGTTYDCVTRMPLIIARPEEASPGAVRHGLASAVDVMPTILNLAGVAVPDTVQGVSLVPAMQDPAIPGRDAVLIENAGEQRSVRTATALLTWHGEGQRGELYDTVADPLCLHNLWDSPGAAALQRQLMDRLIRLLVANIDPLPRKAGAC